MRWPRIANTWGIGTLKVNAYHLHHVISRYNNTDTHLKSAELVLRMLRILRINPDLEKIFHVVHENGNTSLKVFLER